jgi:hypothetical protein
MTDRQHNRRITYLFALLTGLIGLLALLWRFTRQRAVIDLSTLLAFALLALIVTRFRVSVGHGRTMVGPHAEIGLAGTVLLGATLAGGPALGGWAAFVTGIAVGLSIAPAGDTSPRQWPRRAADALYAGGCNVLAVEAAWAAYTGLGGHALVSPRGLTQAIALVVLCLTYAAVRLLWQWLTRLVQHATAPPTPGDLLAEALPLPVALLTAAVFAHLGWSYFLLLALLLIGLSAVIYYLQRHIQALQDDIAARELAHHIERTILSAPHDLPTLSDKAYAICHQFAPAPYCELGILDDLQTHVQILISALEGSQLPAMRIPLTPLWEWMREHTELQIYGDRAQIDRLPFAMPGIDKDRPTRSALLAPIAVDVAPDTRVTLGAIILRSHEPDAFGARHAHSIGTLTTYLARAINAAQESQP